MSELIRDNMIKQPIIVDRNTGIILDGHHRYNAARILGLKKIPVFFVDYLSDDVKIEKRREDIEVSKEIVLEKVRQNPDTKDTFKHFKQPWVIFETEGEYSALFEKCGGS